MKKEHLEMIVSIIISAAVILFTLFTGARILQETGNEIAYYCGLNNISYDSCNMTALANIGAVNMTCLAYTHGDQDDCKLFIDEVQYGPR